MVPLQGGKAECWCSIARVTWPAGQSNESAANGEIHQRTVKRVGGVVWGPGRDSAGTAVLMVRTRDRKQFAVRGRWAWPLTAFHRVEGSLDGSFTVGSLAQFKPGSVAPEQAWSNSSCAYASILTLAPLVALPAPTEVVLPAPRRLCIRLFSWDAALREVIVSMDSNRSIIVPSLL